MKRLLALVVFAALAAIPAGWPPVVATAEKVAVVDVVSVNTTELCVDAATCSPVKVRAARTTRFGFANKPTEAREVVDDWRAARNPVGIESARSVRIPLVRVSRE